MGIMEKKMETTVILVLYKDYTGVVLGLYQDYRGYMGLYKVYLGVIWRGYPNVGESNGIEH